MDLYLWLKALHVAAAFTWIGGMLVAGLSLAGLTPSGKAASPDSYPFLDVARRWDRHVTSPAMLIVWGLGITMAMQAGWFSSHWLMVKLAVVVFLSGLHGFLAGKLRRAVHADGQVPILRYAAPLTIIGIVLIAILAIGKPF